jgi:hypothetical protein
LLDLNEGERRFYSIQEYAYNEETEEARISYVKRPEISCFSKQTLTSNFIPLSIENFGRPIKSIKKEEGNGLIISLKLHWFEAIIFYSFFYVNIFHNRCDFSLFETFSERNFCFSNGHTFFQIFWTLFH